MLTFLPDFWQSARMTTEILTSDVGAKVRAEMGRQRVTMVELSRRTGVARSTLANQINLDTLTVYNLVAIAQALGVRPSTLLIDEVAA